MTLEELFRSLSYGELSNLANAVDVTGTIKKEQQNRIVAFANEGLKRLHLRLPLSEELETLALTPGEALDHELDDDVLFVSSLVTEEGESLTIHTRTYPNTVYVVDQVLHIPIVVGNLTDSLQATYRKKHAELLPVFDTITDTSTIVFTYSGGTATLAAYVGGVLIEIEGTSAAELATNFADAIEAESDLDELVSADAVDDTVTLTGLGATVVELTASSQSGCNIAVSATRIRATPGLDQEITLIPELHEALTAYIAQKVFGSMLGQDAQIAAQSNRARYEQVISEVLNQGLLPSELESMGKFDTRGFP